MTELRYVLRPYTVKTSDMAFGGRVHYETHYTQVLQYRNWPDHDVPEGIEPMWTDVPVVGEIDED